MPVYNIRILMSVFFSREEQHTFKYMFFKFFSHANIQKQHFWVQRYFLGSITANIWPALSCGSSWNLPLIPKVAVFNNPKLQITAAAEYKIKCITSLTLWLAETMWKAPPDKQITSHLHVSSSGLSLLLKVISWAPEASGGSQTSAFHCLLKQELIY